MTRLMLAFAMFIGMTMAVRADDAAAKKDVDQIVVAYMAAYNKHDPAGVAKLFAKEYVYVVPAGPVQVDKYLEAAFKAIPDAKLDAKADKAWMVTPDVLAAQGTANVKGKNTTTNMDVNADNFWTAIYIKEDGVWKAKMLTVALKPPPAK